MRMTITPTTIQRRMEVKPSKPVIGLMILIEKVARKTKYAKSDVGTVMRAALEQIAAETARGNTVRLPGIGTFSLSERSERMANSFGNGPVVVPAHKTVRFKAARPLKNAIK